MTNFNYDWPFAASHIESIMDLSQKDIKALEAQDHDTLAQWWCTMNRLEWPLGLSKLPDDSGRVSDIMKWICATVGRQKVSNQYARASTDSRYQLREQRLRKRMMEPAGKVKVKGLLAIDDSLDVCALNNPHAEPFFHIIIYFNDGVRYNVVTKDGTSFYYVDFITIMDRDSWPRIWDLGGPFSPENKSMIQGAIKNYVKESCNA